GSVRVAARGPAGGIRPGRVGQRASGGGHPPDRELIAAPVIPRPSTGRGARFLPSTPSGPRHSEEANGARWPSRSSKSVAPRESGRLGSTPRRFRQSLRERAFAVDGGQDGRGIREIFEHHLGAGLSQLAGGILTGRDGHDSRAMRVRARDVAWRVADNDDSIGVEVEWQAARPSAVERNRNEMVAIVRVFAKGAAAEVPPEVEMTEFHLRGLGIIAG